jgi:hypothetical protein
MKIAAGFRMAVALTLVAGTIVAASCATELDLGPIPSYEAALPEGAARPFIVYGDSRRRLTSEFWRGDNNAGRQAIVQALADERPAFIFNTGDLVMAGSERAEWRWFHEQNRPIFERQIPYFAGLGNHEYMWKSRQGMENFFAYFPQLKGRLWYEIRYPPALCLVLDSNFHELKDDEIEAQDRWLSEILAAAERDPAIHHVLLGFHHAPFTNCLSHSDSREVKEHFLSRLTPKVHVVVTGHVHSYERFLVDGVQYLVSGGGGAPLMPVDIKKPHHEDQFHGPAYRPAHYCRFTPAGDRLTCDVLMYRDGAWQRVDGFECP